MKVRIFIEAWNNQDVIEMDEDDFKKLSEMPIMEKEDYIKEYLYNCSFCNNIVEIMVTEVK